MYTHILSAVTALIAASVVLLYKMFTSIRSIEGYVSRVYITEPIPPNSEKATSVKPAEEIMTELETVSTKASSPLTVKRQRHSQRVRVSTPPLASPSARTMPERDPRLKYMPAEYTITTQEDDVLNTNPIIFANETQDFRDHCHKEMARALADNIDANDPTREFGTGKLLSPYDRNDGHKPQHDIPQESEVIRKAYAAYSRHC